MQPQLLPRAGGSSSSMRAITAPGSATIAARAARRCTALNPERSSTIPPDSGIAWP